MSFWSDLIQKGTNFVRNNPSPASFAKRQIPRARDLFNNQVDNFRVGIQTIPQNRINYAQQQQNNQNIQKVKNQQIMSNIGNTIDRGIGKIQNFSTNLNNRGEQKNRNIFGNTAGNILNKTINVPQKIATNFVIRPFTQQVGEIVNQARGKGFTPTSNASKLVFGNKDVGTVSQHYGANKKVADQLGLGKYGAPAAAVATGLSMAGSLFPLAGGGESKVAKEAVALKDASPGMKLATSPGFMSLKKLDVHDASASDLKNIDNYTSFKNYIVKKYENVISKGQMTKEVDNLWKNGRDGNYMSNKLRNLTNGASETPKIVPKINEYWKNDKTKKGFANFGTPLSNEAKGTYDEVIKSSGSDFKMTNDFAFHDSLPKEPSSSRKVVKIIGANAGPNDMIVHTDKGSFQRNSQTMYKKVPVKVISNNVAGHKYYDVVDSSGALLDRYDGALPKEEVLGILNGKGADFIHKADANVTPIHYNPNTPTPKVETPPITPKNTPQGIVGGVGTPVEPIKATRSFTQTVKSSKVVNSEVSKGVKDQLYTVRNTEELGIKAKNLVDTYPNIALDMANSNKVDDQVVAVSNELIKKYSYSTNPAEVQIAVDLTEKLTPKLTEAGKTIQAASLINRLSPEGILVFTQRQLNKAAKINPKFSAQMSTETAMKLTETIKSIQNMPDGYEKTLATAQLHRQIQDLIPQSMWKKIATIQTMAQLLNPKTIVRNLVGNTGFAGQEAVSQTLATPIDRLVGLFTGKKTVALPNPITQGKSLVTAGKQAAREAGLGVNTSALTSQFELNQVPVFKNKMLAQAEKGLNYALRVPDRAAYSSAFDDTLKGLMSANKVEKPADWMLEAAHQTGLYRTFQDSSNTAKLFTKIKSGLNFGQEFGLGDFVLKYPKTPANIISRGIDYSPAGYVKALYNLAFIKNPANQREFSMGLARATTGTASLVGLGALLGGMGIITEAPQKDTDLRNLQKKTGLGGYQLNLSALKRYFNSGFDRNATKLQPNDSLVTYDWFQPAAIGLSMGAKIANNMKSGKKPTNDLTGIVTESINSGVSTLAEQPLMRGVTNLVAGYGGLVENLKDTAAQSLASFIPTISNQLAQLIDTDQSGHTKVRDVSSLSFVDESIKRIQTKIPFLRERLPQSVDVMGDPMVYNSKAGLLQTFVTPYFLSNYSPTPQTQELFNLMDVTGETKQFPRTVDKSLTINGNTIKLTPEQIRQYQGYVGSNTNQILNKLLNDPAYLGLDDATKVTKITNILTDINAAAKKDLFGSTAKTDTGATAILGGSYSLGKILTEDEKIIESYKQEIRDGKRTGFTYKGVVYYRASDGSIRVKKVTTAKATKAKSATSKVKKTASIAKLKAFKVPNFKTTTIKGVPSIKVKATRVTAAQLAKV